MQVRFVLFFLSTFLIQSVFCSEKKRVSLLNRLSKGWKLKKEAKFQQELQQLIQETRNSKGALEETSRKSVEEPFSHSKKSNGRASHAPKRILNNKKSKVVHSLKINHGGAEAAKETSNNKAIRRKKTFSKSSVAAVSFLENKDKKNNLLHEKEEKNND